MNPDIIPCQLLKENATRIAKYAEALRQVAPQVGDHGLDETEFWESGLFVAAVERLRGQRAATTEHKYNFVREILTRLVDEGSIASFEYTGSGERHDFELKYHDGFNVAIELKGCLDGNNTNIFLRPPSADEFVIWSLCQNPGADPRHNLWSGLHTRLGAEIIHRRERVDALVVWDMLCSTSGRLCPKLTDGTHRATVLKSGKMVPPPCIYLFPRSIPDARNNPNPRSWSLSELRFASSLATVFGTLESEVTTVSIEARMSGATVERKTVLTRDSLVIKESDWTKLNRAR